MILNRVDHIKKIEGLSQEDKFELIGNVEDHGSKVQQGSMTGIPVASA